jgi:hypothetical protein
MLRVVHISSGSIVVYKESGSFWAWYSSRRRNRCCIEVELKKSRMDTTRPINNILCVGERDLGKWVTDTDDFFRVVHELQSNRPGSEKFM